MNVLRPTIFRQAIRFPSSQVHYCARGYAFTSAGDSESRPELPFRPDEEKSFLPQGKPFRRGKYKPIPESPTFFTTRPVYNDQIRHLEKAIGSTEHYLRQQHLLPLPDFAKASLPPLVAAWKDNPELSFDLRTKLSTTRYRRIIKLLNQLNDFERVATTGGCPELASGIRDILQIYETGKKEALIARGKRKITSLDIYGRSYTVGKRKTSSARVWMIPVRLPTANEADEASDQTPTEVTTSTILINNLPLSQFFPLPADREKITRPFKVAGNLGKYNVFAIVRGGGTSGQSGAVAHGISKGIVAHEPELDIMFRRAKLAWRDPRMVERKKTNRAKARKGYTWVKR